jgi:glycosyltransferase involved in cell wall biosynthesis
MKIICRQGSGYNEKRQFLSHNIPIRPKWDAAAILEKISFRLTRRGYQPTWKSFFFRPFDPSVFIGFNSIRIDGGPCVTFFETTLPRISNKRTLLRFLQVRAMKKAHCKSLVAISDCAMRLQLELQLQHQPIHVLHPPQNVLVDHAWKKRFEHAETIHFCFVGRDFARKGGIEILRAFNQLGPHNWRLTIVSDLLLNDYATQYSHEEQIQLRIEIDGILQNRKSQIEHFENLDNSRVLELMKTTHVGLLPTWHDTYGYSVLEFQANGCPVVTTDVRALPEINNSKCGWVLPVGAKFEATISPLDEEERRREFSKTLEYLLVDAFEDILSGTGNDLAILAEQAVERIRREHDPAAHKVRLTEILEKQ